MKQVTLIAFEFPPYHGGIANYSHGMATYFYWRGYEVRVITINPNSISKGYLVRRPFKRLDSSLLMIRKPLSLLYRLYQYAFVSIELFQLVLFRRQSNVIITSLFFDFSTFAATVFTLTNRKFAVVLHGLDLIELRLKNEGKFKRMLKNAFHLYTNSNFTRRQMLLGYPEMTEKTEVFQPRLDTTLIDGLELLKESEIRSQFGLGPNTKIVLSICRLIERKGLQYGVMAMQKHMLKSDGWLYLIAGEGQYEGVLRSLVNKDFQDRIKFLGAVSDLEKYSLLSLSSVFLMPNLFISELDVEGFGISFLEATYLRNWVIGGDNGGVPEAVDTSTNAYLVDTSSEGVENEILQCLEDISKRDDEEMVLDAGREYVIRNHALR